MDLKKEMMTLRKKWDELNSGWTGTLIYSVLGILVAFLLNSSLGVVLGTPLPVVTVSSGSMVPTLNIGDIVFIRAYEAYEPGQIIVFNGWRKEPIIHRVVARIASDGEIEKWGGFDMPQESLQKLSLAGQTVYVTKGDHNSGCDQCFGSQPNAAIGQQDVYGASLLVIPYLGWVKILFVMMFGDNFLLGLAFVFAAILLYSYAKEQFTGKKGQNVKK